MAMQSQKMKTLCLMQKTDEAHRMTAGELAAQLQDYGIQAESKREGEKQFRHFDLAAFAKKTFGMYGGRDETVTLLCHNSLIGVMPDRFGQEVRGAFRAYPEGILKSYAKKSGVSL